MKTKRLPTLSFFLAGALAAAALVGCGRNPSASAAPADPSDPAASAPAAAPASPFLNLAPGADGFVEIPLARVSDKALFANVAKEGAPAVQLLAIRDGAGRARVAFNTCQACSPSPRAFFAQAEDGLLVCQNCRNAFGPEAVGDRRGGCNPAFVPGVEETDAALRVPAAALDSARPAFARWAGPRGP